MARQRRNNTTTTATTKPDDDDSAATKRPHDAGRRRQRRSCVFYLIPAIFAVTICYAIIIHWQRTPSADAPPTHSTVLTPGTHNVTCDAETFVPYVAGCAASSCARVIVDGFISRVECAELIHMVDSALAVTGGGDGPPSILDLSSGALSAGQNFVDVYKLRKKHGFQFNAHTLALYRRTAARVADKVRDVFGVSQIWFTQPAFFSRINGSRQAVTMHDEYYHEHIDKIQYGSFAYTALLYLNDHDTDYTGGAFQFTHPRSPHTATVEPRAGRLSIFTSGAENAHKIQQVTSGVRYAVTLAFTCDSVNGRSARQLIREDVVNIE